MRLAAYCRVSTDKEEQQRSLEAQKLFFTDFAERNCHTLVKLYADATPIIGLKQNPPKRASL